MNMQPRNKTVSVAWRCGSFLFLAKIGHQNLKNVIDYDSGFETPCPARGLSTSFRSRACSPQIIRRTALKLVV